MSTPFPIDVGASSDLALIRTDLPMADTLQEASDTLDAALAILRSEARNSRTAVLWGVVTLVQLAKGMTDATIERADCTDELEACRDRA